MLSDAMMADHGRSVRPTALSSSYSTIKLDYSSFELAGPVKFYVLCNKIGMQFYIPMTSPHTIHGDSGQPELICRPETVGRGRLLSRKPQGSASAV